MAINPIQNTAVEKGNIISAASDMTFFLENSINDKQIYHGGRDSKLNEISNFSNLYNYHSLDSLSGFLKDERLSNVNFNIKQGEIIKGENTFNWIDYCYKYASEIRWCKFLYKNSDYLDNNIGFDPSETTISSKLIYALSLDAFVYLSSSVYTSAIVEKNNLSETGWQKCGGGISSQINFLSNDKLSSFVSVNKSNFEVSTLIEASDINNTISTYNSILDLNNKAKDLSCEFCDGKDTYNYFYGDDDDSEDNLKNAVNVKFILFSNENNSQYVYNVFNFTGNYNNISDNGKIILNDIESWKRLANKQYNGSNTVGQSNWDKHKLFSNFTFSLADLGIIGINVNFTFNGWHIVRTAEDKTSLSDATSLFGSTDKTKHFYFEYDNKTNFNSIKNVPIGVNLSQPNSRYWIIPDISATIPSTTLTYADGSSAPNETSIKNLNNKDGFKLQSGQFCTGIPRGVKPGGVNTEISNNNVKLYGLKWNSDTLWTPITSANDHNNNIKDSDYYPISCLTQLIFGTKVAHEPDVDSSTYVWLTASIKNRSGNTLRSVTVTDRLEVGRTRSNLGRQILIYDLINPYYIEYTQRGDDGYETGSQYYVAMFTYKKRITKNIKF